MHHPRCPIAGSRLPGRMGGRGTPGGGWGDGGTSGKSPHGGQGRDETPFFVRRPPRPSPGAAAGSNYGLLSQVSRRWRGGDSASFTRFPPTGGAGEGRNANSCKKQLPKEDRWVVLWLVWPRNERGKINILFNTLWFNMGMDPKIQAFKSGLFSTLCIDRLCQRESMTVTLSPGLKHQCTMEKSQ